MIAGIGTDIIEIYRVEKALSPAFLKRVYTEKEQDYCEKRGAGKYASYGARWAGKEAVLKAFGTGLRQGTLLVARDRGIKSVWISLSHSKDYATAQCVMEK